MSFGFGGNNNNNNSNSAFGGFGNSNTGGFGANTNTTTSGSLFGGGTATSGGFGGFGGNTNTGGSPFGGANKPAFGASAATTSGGSLFGNNTSTSGGFGGGFGNTGNTGSGFGGNTGGGLFGQQNKPAATGFGASNTGGSLFGGGNTSGGFGGATNTANTNTNPFGGGAATSFGASNTNNAAGGGFGGFGASSTATNNNNNNSGTAAVPFQAFSERDGTAGQTSSYQSLGFQDPYKNKTFEELRVEDYAQGRRFGNTNGQAGGFGQSTGFGGFGATNTSSAGSPFGNNTATSGANNFGGFGGNTGGASSSFGNNTGGGLFGQNKPAAPGLFGNTASSAPATGGFGGTASSGGGLFGNNAGGGFGANAGASSAGANPFGGNAGQQQSNPFGTSTTNTGGGLFGNQNKPAGGGLFGNTNTSGTGGSLFGGNNQQAQPQQQQSNPFGSSTAGTGGSLFGGANQQQQNKPAFGGFGGSTNTGGAFGGGSNTGGGLFGNAGNTGNTGGGLFGGQNQAKPAGTGLFGSSTNNNSGGSLFGGANQNQAGSSLFGNNTNSGSSLFGNQNKPAGGSLFGNNQNTSGTGAGQSLFGGQQQQQQNQNSGSSLFGNNNQGGSSLFGGNSGGGGSLFGSQQQQQPQPQQNQLHASVTGSPYGNDQLFSSLAAPSPPVGPLATPLSNARPPPRKTPSLLGSMRLNTPVYTPRGGSIGRTAGYGFSYSTYGTPGSAYSGSLTPGASSLLRPTGSLSSGLTSRLNKSVSMSNLRGDATPNQSSLLRPSALSPPGSGALGTGSVRKLRIDRSLRTDLFGPAREAEGDAAGSNKRVSFQASNTGAKGTESAGPQPSGSNALVRTETDEQDDAPSFLRAAPQSNASKAPEMSQVKGNAALTTVPEDDVPSRPASAPAAKKPAEKAGRKMDVGDYWTEPSIKHLEKMGRQQLQKLGKFSVGRDGVGRIEFGPCDLSNVPLDDICGDIVRLDLRSATVYHDDQHKPKPGEALNVPSVIHLENSWPRSAGGKQAVAKKSGKEYEKHLTRLKRVAGTQFVNYEPETGVWTFRVEHFTTYGLDEEDEEDEEESALTELPTTPGQQDQTMESIETETGEVDDTFEFKHRAELSVPGGFGSTGVSYDYDDPSADEEMDEGQDAQMMSGGLGEQGIEDPFMSSGGAVQAPSPAAVERYHSSMLEDQTEEVEMADDEPEMPGSFVEEPKMLRSILKPSTRYDAFASPEKLATATWEEQLQRTISPRKRDRQALKDMHQSLMKGTDQADPIESPFKQSLLSRSTLGESYLAQKSAKKTRLSGSTLANTNTDPSLGKSQGFQNALQLMNSLWQDGKPGGKTRADGKGFEYPYPKRPRLSNDSMDEQEAAFHDSVKPFFASNGTFVYAAPASALPLGGEMTTALQPIVDEHKEMRFAKLKAPEDMNSVTLDIQRQNSDITPQRDGMPFASTPTASFARLVDILKREDRTTTTALQQQELDVWQLCSILFDRLGESSPELLEGVPEEELEDLKPRMQLDAFIAFWTKLVAPSVESALKQAKSAEEKALLHLTMNDITSACDVLVSAKDYRLATLVAQLPASESSRKTMTKQIEAWRARKDWSEMSAAVRALYCILAGEACVAVGQAGAKEDRADAFSIADRFGLTWQQSFALRVCFAGHATLEEAVRAYCGDLEAERETVNPTTVWDQVRGDDALAGEEDTLMGLLRLFIGTGEPAELCDPLTVSGDALNPRLAFQMAVFLSTNGKIALPDTTWDRLALDLASSLENAGYLTASAWALLHARDSKTRSSAVMALLERNAANISSPGTENPVFEELTQELQIPTSPVWAAKALFAKSQHDYHKQVEFLLSAGLADDAHAVLCADVGPQAVIEEDLEGLWTLLRLFPRRKSDDWRAGWQVYHDYVQMHRMHAAQRAGREGGHALQSLHQGLAGMEEDVSGQSLEQRVAVIEMKRFAEAFVREQGVEEVVLEDDSDRVKAKAGKKGLDVRGDAFEAYRFALGQVV